jgi:hypothetical protein
MLVEGHYTELVPGLAPTLASRSFAQISPGIAVMQFPFQRRGLSLAQVVVAGAVGDDRDVDLSTEGAASSLMQACHRPDQEAAVQ